MGRHSTQIPDGPSEYEAFRMLWQTLTEMGEQAGFIHVGHWSEGVWLTDPSEADWEDEDAELGQEEP